MKELLAKKILVVGLITLLISLLLFPAINMITPVISRNNKTLSNTKYSLSKEKMLPPPLNLEITIEETISRRMSIREFTGEPVKENELSTILWAAYGINKEGRRTVPRFDTAHAVEIYVINESGVYKYQALEHSLILYKKGDYRNQIKQYYAPIQIGLVWNKSKSTNENSTGAELGAVGQNIYFAVNALGLGTVVTGEVPSPLNLIGLPPNEDGRLVMPIGYPKHPYNFNLRPMWISLLPKIQFSSLSLTDALEHRNQTTSWNNIPLNKQEMCQMMWSSYGYSYYLDKSQQENNPVKRHRTVPSGHGYYPLEIYGVNSDGTFKYIANIVPIDLWGLPIITFFLPICKDDNRDIVANATESKLIKNAPMHIICVLNIRDTIKSYDDLSDEKYRWVWSYEAGAALHNIQLVATAWNLSSYITSVIDKTAICSLLHLDCEKFDPLFVIAIGPNN